MVEGKKYVNVKIISGETVFCVAGDQWYVELAVLESVEFDVVVNLFKGKTRIDLENNSYFAFALSGSSKSIFVSYEFSFPCIVFTGIYFC